MNIVILDGDKDCDEFSILLNETIEELKKNHNIVLFSLNEMNLHYCTGCFACWCKTPGECAIKDDAAKIFKSYINADFVIFASPIIAGFTSSLLKKITDRLIVLLHPYAELINNETHHKKRYDHYPDFGVLVTKEKETDKEDIEIISDIYSRFAINFHCSMRFLKILEESDKEEINNEFSYL